MSSIIIVGVDSYIGSSLKSFFQNSGWQVIGTSRQKGTDYFLDLEQPDSWSILSKYDSIPVIFCASMSRITECEKSPSKSYNINVTATKKILEILLSQDCFPIFLSSNLVFSGSKADYAVSDIPDPSTHYGNHKLKIENFLSSCERPYAVIRLTKVIGNSFPLIEEFIAKSECKEFVEPFNDLVLAPVLLDDVVNMVHHILANKDTGLFHLSGAENLSYEQLLLGVFDELALDVHLIKAKSVSELGVRRSLFSSLRNRWPAGYSARTDIKSVLAPFILEMKKNKHVN